MKTRRTSPLACWTAAALTITLSLSPCIRVLGADAKKETKAADADKHTYTTEWSPLFDGKTLKGWKQTPFAGTGGVKVEDGRILIEMGVMLTGVNYTNATPKMNYEVSLEAMRVMGSDFFCALTFPVKDSHCSLILGGWGGGIVGISSVDGYDASENEATTYRSFKSEQWYKILLRVTPERIFVWIDGEEAVNLHHEGRSLSVRAGEIEDSIPFGIASWQTTGALRHIKVRLLPENTE